MTLKHVYGFCLVALSLVASLAVADGSDGESIKTWWLGSQSQLEGPGKAPALDPTDVFGDPVASFLKRISSGNEAEIGTIDSKGIELNVRGQLDITPLIWLAAGGNANAVKRAIELGADPQLRTSSGTTALMIAAREGHQEVIDALLKANAELNPQDVNGNTALIYATSTGRSGIVASLLAAGADFRIANGAGQTARQVAVLSGQGESYDLIVKAAQTVRPRDVFEAPLLIRAAEAIQAGDIAALLKVVDKDNVNATGNGGATLLMFALREGRLDAYRSLLELGADPNQTTTDGYSTVYLAPRMKDAQYLDLALLHGGDANRIGPNKATPLLAATAAEHLENVRLLLSKGANPNSADGQGARPLTNAILYDSREIVGLLLDAGADPQAKDQFGESAIDFARALRRDDLVQRLLKAAESQKR